MSVWRMPLVVTALSAAALVVGLVADGPADVVAWLGASLPVGVTAWHVARGLASRRPT